MTYEPQAGDIGLVSISGDVGKAIRVGQWLLAAIDQWTPAGRSIKDDEDWANYQHAFVYLGNGMLIEAEPGGARIRPLSEYDGASIYWCRHISAGLSPKTRNAIVLHAQALLKTPYSFLDYFALTARKLHIWLPGLRFYVQLTRHLICSALAVWSYELGGSTVFDGVWPGYVDPLDLFLLDKKLAGEV